MLKSRLTLVQINALDQAAFVEHLSFVFEGPPWIVEQAWAARPFASLDDLHQALCQVLNNASETQQVNLIQAHPDLVGKAALAGTLTAESTSEQAAAGLDRLSAAEIAAFNQYNQAYQQRFGFPFVICARENKKDTILAGFAARLTHTRQQEIATALREIAKIARFRLLDRIVPTA